MREAQFDFQPSADCSKHLYQWKWTEIAPPAADHQPGGVFVIAGDALIAAQIADDLRSRSIECVVASAAESLPDIIESLGSSCKAVIWTSAERTSSPESAVDQVCDVFSLARSVTAGKGNPPDIWLLTTGVHEIESNFGSPNDLPSASQAAVWGMARAIAHAHPELRCNSVDLSQHPEAREFELLSRLVLGSIAEEQMAIRGTSCYGHRLERQPDAGQPEVFLQENATYLITGGFGDLGLSLAAFLADRGAGHIALVGRGLPRDMALERLARIESHGTKVHRFQADVANYSEIAAVVTEIGDRMAPLKGVFHLAGVTQDALLSNFSRESLEQVMRPKVFGSWNLHCLTAKSDLDYFVMYSSVASVFSQSGQGTYAAANAYLDGLATLRHTCGLPGMSIQWGPWKDAGMSRESGAARSLLAWAEQGIGALSAETALNGVHRLLARPASVSLVAAVNWNRFGLSSSGNTSHLFSEFVAPADSTSRAESGIRDRLIALPLAERAAMLESRLKAIVAAVLKSKASRIDSTRRFGSLGVDSLMAVEIARRVTDTLGTRLPVTAIFNFPTLELLAKEMARRLEPESQAAPLERPDAMESRKTSAKPPMSAIAQMSEEEALQSLVKAVETT
jgi:NADP-dependent 3-hydroxy acid dehydrogenase YdfG/acyl carrier protein